MLEYSIIFIEEIIIYCMLLKIIYKQKLRRKWTIGIMFTFFCILMNANMYNYAIFFMLAIVIVGFGFMLETTVLEKFKMLSLVSITFLIEGELVHTFMKLLNLNVYADDRRFIQNYTVIIVSLVIILVITRNRQNIRKKENVLTKNFLLYIILLFMELVLLMSVTLVQFAVKYVPNKTFETFFDVVAILGFISMGVVIALVTYIVKINGKISNSLKNEKTLREMQKIYYNTLLDKEEETKKFRHDISSHLVCILELAEKNGDDYVVDYIKKLESRLDNIVKKVYYTGNNIADILINYYLSKINSNVKVVMNGYLNEEVGINATDMCTILSNLLKNAVEEVNRTDKESHINISFSKGKQYVAIEIENSKSTVISSKWSKEENEKHGYGLKNVNDVVKQNNGSIEIQQDKQTFRVKVIFEISNKQSV